MHCQEKEIPPAPEPKSRKRTEQTNAQQILHLESLCAQYPNCVRKVKRRAIFFGDSWFERFLWVGGPSGAVEPFESIVRPCVDHLDVFAVGGDKTCNAVWRATEGGAVATLSQRVVADETHLIILLGINDVAAPAMGKVKGTEMDKAQKGAQAARDAVGGVYFIARQLQASLLSNTSTKIHIFEVPLLPLYGDVSRHGFPLMRGDADAINAAFRGQQFRASGFEVHALHTELLDAAGTVKGRYLVDDVHLNSQGYTLFAEQLRRILVPAPASTHGGASPLGLTKDSFVKSVDLRRGP